MKGDMGLLPTSMSNSHQIPISRSTSPIQTSKSQNTLRVGGVGLGSSSILTSSSSSSSISNIKNNLSSNNPNPFFSNSNNRSRSGSEKLKRLIQRLIRPSRWPTMDFELAGWQMTYLCIAPRRVYRNVYYHKQTKNTWSRDDPAILIMLIGLIGSSSLLWTIFYLRSFSPLTWIVLTLKMVFRDFILTGIIISTFLWAISNKFLTQSTHSYATEQRVEWQYSFDIHVNSFFPLFLNLYVCQLILVHVLTRENWVSLWVGNSLYLIAVTQYAYVTYLGYNALPFLNKSEILLIPIVGFLLSYFISLLGFNVCKNFLKLYFSW